MGALPYSFIHSKKLFLNGQITYKPGSSGDTRIDQKKKPRLSVVLIYKY